MKQRIFFLLLCLWLGTCFPLFAQNSERILNFDAVIQVQSDGSLLITEKITVRAAGDQIKRGIVRTIPVSYKSEDGKWIHGDFAVQYALRGEEAENYRVQKSGQEVSIYFGDRDVLLEPGIYVYTFCYTLTRQLGFYEDFDELYWNVTGHNWDFPIEKAHCEVRLPDGAHVLEAMAYEGKSGSTAKTAPVRQDERVLEFSSGKIYPPGEGMTVAVSWPKGVVADDIGEGSLFAEPSDKTALFAGIAGLCLLFAYYLFAWMRVGRDPEKGVIIPRFEPPDGFSPAMCRVFWKKNFDAKAFSASLVNIAVHKGLEIRESKGNQSLFIAKAKPAGLSTEEEDAWKVLASGPSPLDLKVRNRTILEIAKGKIGAPLVKKLDSYFKTNLKWFLPGLLFTFPIGFFASGMNIEAFPVFFLLFWIAGWSVGCFALLRSVLQSFRQKQWASGIGATLFALPFWGGLGVAFFMLYLFSSLMTLCILLVTIALHGLFLFLLRAPTPLGQGMADQLAGFRLYLSVAEKDRLKILYSEQETPETFEKFLPYAMALDLENEWGNRFSAVLERASYSPDWYQGSDFSTRRPVRFVSNLGKAVASATPAPRSSSSSSGSSGTRSGSSGGGRGGGGGGGW